ncbi:MAG: hypothetical protein P8185_07780, partial [Deltaproteobacteria bacterium]
MANPCPQNHLRLGKSELNPEGDFCIRAGFLLFFSHCRPHRRNTPPDQIVENMEESISILTIDEANDIDEHFRRLEALGKKSAKIIPKWLDSPLNSKESGLFF